MGTSGLKPACRIDATYAFQTACAPRIVLDQQIALSDQQIVYSTTEQMCCLLEWRFTQKRCIPAAQERFRQRQIAASSIGLPAMSCDETTLWVKRRRAAHLGAAHDLGPVAGILLDAQVHRVEAGGGLGDGGHNAVRHLQYCRAELQAARHLRHHPQVAAEGRVLDVSWVINSAVFRAGQALELLPRG